jgi:ferric iron reductase protein FhuF
MTIDEVIKKIFYYIDTYYDENKGAIVQELIEDYIRSLNNGESLSKGNNES